MKNKLTILIFLLSLSIFLTLGAVSATDNNTLISDSNNITINSDLNNISTGDSYSNLSENNNSKFSTNLTANELIKYYGVDANFTGILTNTSGNPVIGQHIAINLTRLSTGANKIYWVTTDTEGEFQLAINLAPGSYTCKSYFYGSNFYENSTSLLEDIIVTTNNTGLNKSVLIAENLSKNVGVSDNFTGYLYDSQGNPIIGQNISMKLTRLSNNQSKTYYRNTSMDGMFFLPINLSKGSYTIYCTYNGNEDYALSNALAFINIKQSYYGKGIFVRYQEMSKVNFQTLKNNNISTIFLNYGATFYLNQSSIESWIKTANNYGINVSIWAQICFNNSKWYNPLTNNGEINTTLLNQKIAQVTSFAKIAGVNGIFLDYIRFGGDAYNFNNGSISASESINYFVSQLTNAIKKVNGNLIVSGAIMADTQGVYYYGQNVSSLSKYLDIVIPMIYSQNNDYVSKMTKYYVNLSNTTSVWTAVRTYVSETNTTALPVDVIENQTSVVNSSGANGVAYFRFGLMNFVI